ncbi:phage protein Gp27 family protein [Roseospira visakhapatnamensis]|uniref:DUF3486 family protein n=1 Tax=Roseospira visakhapatnamensis TaxID=390880 RepID=A0A7W6RGA5_9PROT|nr:phage protein Gp27 family protein [Roseospira visakhapatnamensis]MBB4267777.1 hypothetical protein [Roseospira visakhapatnamensis]
MGRRSSIRRLPAEVRQEIDRLLGQEHTLDEILAHLRTLGADSVSRSALGRYATDFREVAARLRETKVAAAGFARELGVVPEGEAHMVLVQMLQARMMRSGMDRIKDDDAKEDAKELMYIARTIRDLMASTKDREAIKAQLAKEIAAENKAKLDDLDGEAEPTKTVTMREALDMVRQHLGVA